MDEMDRRRLMLFSEREELIAKALKVMEDAVGTFSEHDRLVFQQAGHVVARMAYDTGFTDGMQVYRPSLPEEPKDD